jgi:tetratricopeptide (TPR) repeat protein
MAGRTDPIAPPEQFTSFGELLKYLRRRARLTQRELAAAVSYNYSHISRLENGLRAPDVATLNAVFLPALRLNPSTDAPVIARLTELANLARDVAITPTTGRTGPAPVPRQLPSAVRHFVGRRTQSAQLQRLFEESGTPETPVISVIHGTAGVGKTALATQWAHRFAGYFPDGQLYLDLRGFDPTRSPVEPTEAVRGFLDAFAVPPERVPSGPEALVALYRSVLAGKRLLIVLDNAASVEQARPLLPGTPGSLVLVTSRRQLPGLTAVEGAQPISLDLLSPTEARELLIRHLGEERIDAEPAAAEEIVERCARLPLALALVAARAAARPGFPLATFAEELRTGRPTLDALHDDEQTADVRAVFSWSYQNLGAEAARMFRLLGLAPGPDITAPAAASLAGVPVGRARALLSELASRHMVAEPAPGRYAMHDLLREYAAERAEAQEPEDGRVGAVHRILDHYLHTAHAAGALLYPTRDPISLAPPRTGVTPERMEDLDRAVAWFTTGHGVLLAAVQHATDAGYDTHAWQLAWTVATYLERRGHWYDWAATGRAAVAAAERLREPAIQARSHRSLGFAYTRLGRLDDADGELRRALELYRAVGDTTGQAHTHQLFNMLAERSGRPAGCLEHALLALELYQTAGHRHGQAQAMNNVGWAYGLLGKFEQTLAYCRRALPLLQELGNRDGEANTWDSLGYAHHHLGQYPDAVSCYQRAIDLYRDLGDRYYEADTLRHLGETRCADGDPDGARQDWLAALKILDELGHPDAELIRVRLRALAAVGR